MKARLTWNKRGIVLEGETWSETFPVESLGSRLALYRSLAERRNGKWRRHYTATVNALEEVQKQIETEQKEGEP
jgi:hypothetical protein